MDISTALKEALEHALSRAVATVEDGRRVYVVRSEHGLPFMVHLLTGKRAAAAPPVEGEEAHREAGAAEPLVLVGTASSTSVDWYGTDMSQGCLQSMAGQFAQGVGVYPSHGGGFFGPGLGWDDEMGRTTAAELERAQVADPADATEAGWLLRVTMAMDPDLPKCHDLARRLNKGQAIGLSIGGWFRNLRYIMDDDGEIERIIVEEVELDHLAIVRNPANPDSTDLQLLRDAGRALAARSQVASGAPVVGPASVEPVAEPAPLVEPSTTSNREAPDDGNPSGVTSEQVLDTSLPSSENRSVATEPEPEQEHPMPDNAEVLDLLRAIKAQQDAQTVRLEALEQRGTDPTQVAETPDQKVARLEAQLRGRDAVIDNLTRQPQRTGFGARVAVTASQNPLFAGTEIDALLTRCKDEDRSVALCATVQRAKPMLTVSFRAKGEQGRILREATEAAPDMLREILESAEADGTLHDWQRLHV